MTKFRISAHRLAIERDRYNKPPLNQKKEFVPHVPTNQSKMNNTTTQDEKQICFRMSQIIYDTDRKGLFGEVEKRCSNFRDLNKQDAFVYLMTADTQIAGPVAKSISKNMLIPLQH